MRFPWTKKRVPEPTMAELLADAERLEDLEKLKRQREDAFKRHQEEIRREAKWRAGRIMAIPQNLEGFRLANGCSCGGEEEWFRATGYWPNNTWYSSAQPRHEPDCDRLLGLTVMIIEVNGPLPKPWLEEQNLLTSMSEAGVS